MLGKLLKYDFKAQAKSLIPMYLITIAIAILTRLMSMLTDKFPIVSTIYGLVMALCIFSLVGVMLWTMVVTIRHFYNNILKDEGYLTNTLPVTRNQIILSKELLSIVTMVIAVAVLALGIIIAFYHGSVKDILDSLNQIFEVSDIDVVSFWFWIIITMITSYISYIQLAFLAMMFGQTSNTNKVLFSIVYAILIYIVLSVLEFAVLGIDYLISPDIMKAMEASSVVAIGDIWQYFQLFFASALIKTLITMGIFHFLTVRMANRKLNLE